MSHHTLEEWKPQPKVVAGAAVALLLGAAQLAWPELEVPVGLEGAAVIIATYLIPNPR